MISGWQLYGLARPSDRVLFFRVGQIAVRKSTRTGKLNAMETIRTMREQPSNRHYCTGLL